MKEYSVLLSLPALGNHNCHLCKFCSILQVGIQTASFQVNQVPFYFLNGSDDSLLLVQCTSISLYLA